KFGNLTAPGAVFFPNLQKPPLIVSGSRFHGGVSSDRSVAVLAESQYGLVTRAQARARGMSEDGIHRRLQAGHWERIHHGVYRLAGSQRSPEQTVLGVCLAGGAGTFASHASAAV